MKKKLINGLMVAVLSILFSFGGMTGISYAADIYAGSSDGVDFYVRDKYGTYPNVYSKVIVQNQSGGYITCWFHFNLRNGTYWVENSSGNVLGSGYTNSEPIAENIKNITCAHGRG
ncbi:MAG: hypothetical protein MR395_10290 [Caecibacter massiliensis]|jgi:hypothetical protein|uniref:hypothetical protein n=1 Tax=uncultured Megasphaera sp. TaxID=165188 RepID=UPI0025EC9221|nr:hypothetical protein [uncultured Megasphaera sp.]MCI5532978.1 hypothetical protein [Caecibacter massiliensis]